MTILHHFDEGHVLVGVTVVVEHDPTGPTHDFHAFQSIADCRPFGAVCFFNGFNGHQIGIITQRRNCGNNVGLFVLNKELLEAGDELGSLVG